MNMAEAWNWLTEDPVGRMVTLGVLVVVALVSLIIALRSMRWAAARWKTMVAVVLGLMYYSGMLLFNMGPAGWAVGGMVAFGAFVGFALVMAGRT